MLKHCNNQILRHRQLQLNQVKAPAVMKDQDFCRSISTKSLRLACAINKHIDTLLHRQHSLSLSCLELYYYTKIFCLSTSTLTHEQRCNVMYHYAPLPFAKVYSHTTLHFGKGTHSHWLTLTLALTAGPNLNPTMSMTLTHTSHQATSLLPLLYINYTALMLASCINTNSNPNSLLGTCWTFTQSYC